MVEVYYREHIFIFESSREAPLAGHLLLDDQSRSLLAQLLASEDDDWCLNRVGEQFPAEKLFQLTPWSLASPLGRISLICRFIDYRDGAVAFNSVDTFPGEMYAYVRSSRGD